MSSDSTEFAGRSNDLLLIVDDDEFMRTVLGSSLRDLGFSRVEAVESGTKALARCNGTLDAPQLILLDLNMPDMDGVEVIRQLGARGFAGALVLLSGEDATTLRAAETLARAHKLRILGSQSKPVAQEALAQLLARHNKAPSSTNRAPSATVPVKAAKRVFSATEVAHAIARGEIINHYQPKVLAESGEVVGVEALARWQHPEAGIVYPDQFIAVAEAGGFICDLTRGVLRSAIAQAAAWRAGGIKLTVAVNITMDDLAAPGFASDAIAMARAARLEPESILLEVTESQLMPDLIRVLDALARLRIHRFRLSIDDFGTGHSSLVQLRDLPFDELKVDRSFTRNAHQDFRLRAFFQTTIDLARSLGMTAVAEGVETAEDWNFVRHAGACCTQGYFIAKPMPADALPAWIEMWHARVRDERLVDQRGMEGVVAHN